MNALFIHNDKHKSKFSSLLEVCFRHKIVKKFIYLYCLMINSAMRKLKYDYFKRANIRM